MVSTKLRLVRSQKQRITIHKRTTGVARTKSPFPMANRSKSPFRKKRLATSSLSERKIGLDEVEGFDNDERFDLHESEISIFQQLCLNKHDDNAAIEILLDSSDNSPDLSNLSAGGSSLSRRIRLSPLKNIDCLEKTATFSTASQSTGAISGVSTSDETLAKGGADSTGSRALSRKKVASVETKRRFLDRFFFKSSKKHPSHGAPLEGIPVGEMVHSSNENKRQCDGPMHESNVLSQPSGPSNARKAFDDSFRMSAAEQWNNPKAVITENKISHDDQVLLSERFDSFSNISSLSGSRATASTRKPIALDRHQSLGVESIQDIRMCLKEMETQLAKASTKGQSVSRKKLMKALFTVADSLDDTNEEHKFLQKELESAAMKYSENSSTGISENNQTVASNDQNSEPTDSGTSDDDDDDDYTQDSSAFGEEDDYVVEEGKETSPFSIMSFFGVDAQNQQVVGEVLDDLLWGDFVSQENPTSRRNNDRTKSRGFKQPRPPHSQARSGKIELKVRNWNVPSKNTNTPQGSPPEAQFSKSWWRHHPNVSREGHTEHEDEDDTISSSDDFPSYLPSSITLKKKEPSLASSTPPANFTPTVVQTQPQLVETESRLGFEMGIFAPSIQPKIAKF